MPAARSRTDLLAIGDTTTDVFLDVHEASVHCEVRKPECLLCVSYADKVPVERVIEILGVGNAANNAVGSARLGLKAALWTILGDDEAGRRTVREIFRREGVDTRFIEFDSEHPTSFAAVIMFQGERTILVHHEPRAYRFPALPSASWAYLTSMGRGWVTIIPSLLQYLRKTGARLGCNPGTHQLASAARRDLLRVLRATEVFIVNREEAYRLLRVRDGSLKTLVRGVRDLGPRIAVVTDGPNGAYAAIEKELWFMPPVPTKVVERTGAGDSFSTGFIAALFYRRSIPEALQWGAANAASVVRYVGAREGLLSRAAVEEALAGRKSVRARKLA